MVFVLLFPCAPFTTAAFASSFIGAAQPHTIIIVPFLCSFGGWFFFLEEEGWYNGSLLGRRRDPCFAHFTFVLSLPVLHLLAHLPRRYLQNKRVREEEEEREKKRVREEEEKSVGIHTFSVKKNRRALVVYTHSVWRCQARRRGIHCNQPISKSVESVQLCVCVKTSPRCSFVPPPKVRAAPPSISRPTTPPTTTAPAAYRPSRRLPPSHHY